MLFAVNVAKSTFYRIPYWLNWIMMTTEIDQFLFPLHQKSLLVVLKKRFLHSQCIKIATRTFTVYKTSYFHDIISTIDLFKTSHFFPLISYCPQFAMSFHRLCAWLCRCRFELIAIVLMVLVFSFTIAIQTTFCFERSTLGNWMHRSLQIAQRLIMVIL